MSTQTGPLTELDAVNLMLRAIGSFGISSLLVVDTNAEAETALGVLRDTSKEVQKKGRHFNTLKGLQLNPDASGRIVLPVNTARVDTVSSSKDVDVVKRGGRLYDRVNHTDTFAGPLFVDLVEILGWDDIPMAAQWYIAVKAARRFAGSRLASDVANKFTKEDEADALIAFEQDDAESDDRTMAQASPHVARMRRR